MSNSPVDCAICVPPYSCESFYGMKLGQGMHLADRALSSYVNAMDTRMGFHRFGSSQFKCVFCGKPADTKDHCPPRCLLRPAWPISTTH